MQAVFYSQARNNLREIINVLRADYSKKGFLRSVEKLSKENISDFGILLNDVKMDRNGYGYGYGYYELDKK